MTKIKQWAKKAIRFASVVFGSGKNIPEFYTKGAEKKIRIDKDVPVFSGIANEVLSGGRTLLGIDRLYTLYQGIVSAPPGSNFLEVGMYKGGSTWFMAKALQSIGNGGKLVGVDTFTGHASVVDGLDGEHKAHANFSDANVDDVRAYLAAFPNVEVVQGDITALAPVLGHARDLGFVHVDVDVYVATKFAIGYAATRLLPGGMIACDDYGFTTCKGAKKAVDEFVAENPGWRKFHSITGQVLLYNTSTPVANG